MKSIVYPSFCSLLILLAVVPACASETPSADTILARMLEQAGGAETFKTIGILEMQVDMDETTIKGEQNSASFHAYVSTVELENLRLELPGDVVIARSGSQGWGSHRGKVDDRPRSVHRAVGDCNQQIAPLILPFSLQMEGVQITEVIDDTFDDQPTWRLTVQFPLNFFTSPIMNVPWHLQVARKDARLLAAQFQPPEEYAEMVKEGVRYRYQKTTAVGGVQLPSQIMMEGVDPDGSANPHVRTVKIATAVRGLFDPTLFLNPLELQQMEE